MFIAAVGKEASLIHALLQQVVSNGMSSPQDVAAARRILEGVRTNGILDSQITNGTAFVVGKPGVRHLDHYLAECGSHG